MAELAFDDLIPTDAPAQAGASLAFDDLIPEPSGTGVGDYATEFAKGAGRGVQGFFTSGLKGIAGSQANRPSYEPGQSPLDQAMRGEDQAFDTYLTGPQAAPRPITEDPLWRGAHAVEQTTAPYLDPANGWEGSWTGDIGSGVGSMAAGVLTSIASGPTALLLFATGGMGEAAEKAQKAGATPEQIQQATRLGTIAGATDVVDALLPSLGTTGKALGFIQRVGARAVAGALAEGGQEGVQQLIQNAIAKGVYKPDQDYFEDVPRSMAIGAIVGGAAGGLMPSHGKSEAKPEAVPEAKPEAPDRQAQDALAEFDAILAQETAPDESPVIEGGTEPEPAQNAPSPVPESNATLQAQQEQMLAGDRAVQMFPAGHPELPVPEGIDRIEAMNGDVFHYRPDRINPFDILTASNEGRENELLGLGPVSKTEVMQRAEQGEQPVAVTERTPEGVEVRGAAGTAVTAPAQVQAIEAVKSPDNTVQVEAPEQVIADRVQPQHGGIVAFTPDQLNVDPKRFQYKASDEHGVTGALKGVAKWDERLANPVTAWQDNAGKIWVVNGHQRTDLAKRAEAQGQQGVRIPGRIYREADGFSPEYMRALGAFQNMAEGTGSAIDAAKVLRANITGLDLPELPPKSQLVQDAKDLARLSDDAFGMVVNDIVPAGYAAQVGRMLQEPAEQLAAMDVLAKAQPANVEQARIMVEDVRNSGFLKGEQTGLFGEEEFARSLVAERARILDRSLKNLRGLGRTFKTAVEQEQTLAEAGNKLERESNVKARTENERLAEILRANGTRKGEISDALSDAAKLLADGKSISAVTSAFLAKVRSLSRGLEPSDERGAETGSDGPALFSIRGKDAALGDLFDQPKPKTETVILDKGAKGEQYVIPGAEKASQATQAQRGADATLKPTTAQKPADIGLFGEKPQPGLFDKPSPQKPREAVSASPASSERQQAPASRNGVIEDFGEKIGGARKDLAEATGARPSTPRRSDDRPTWAKRFTVRQVEVKSSTDGDTGTKWEILDERTGKPLMDPNTRWKPRTFESREQAEQVLPLVAVAQKHRVVSDKDNQFKIIRDVTDRKRVTIKDGFKDRDEAIRYLHDHAIEILETKTGFGEEILAAPEKVMREGAERRNGNATQKDFSDTFGFRGVEFGNWNNQAERQDVMNHAYDGLLDLADLLNVPPKALSLDGQLAIAFGARGHGLSGARAHYERDYGVINLTKMSGAGSLAHEWMHAFDAYLARLDTKASGKKIKNERGDDVYDAGSTGTDYISHGPSYKSQLRQELRAELKDVWDTISTKAETFVEDTQQAEKWLGRAREGLTKALDSVRRDMAEKRTYGSRFVEPANAEQLARFDALAEKLRNGDDIVTSWRMVPSSHPRSAGKGRYTNDTIDAISALYKEVRGRSGFHESRGPIDEIVHAVNDFKKRGALMAQAAEKSEKVRKIPTQFARDAYNLDQGRASDYWTTPHEMMARAMSAYVEDKIAERGGRSEFLSYGSDNALYRIFNARPFPEGKEREAINAALDRLFQTLKTREGRLGPDTALYSAFDARRDLTAKAQKAQPELKARLSAIVKHIAGDHVVVAFPDQIALPRAARKGWGSYVDGKQTAAGSYIPAQHLIRIALNDPKYQHHTNTAVHESFHAVEHLLLDDPEMDVLKKAEPELRKVAQEFADLTPKQAKELADYEVRAIAFEAYAHAKGEQQPVTGLSGAVKVIFERLRQAFARILSALNVMGFKTADDVFSDVYLGKMAGREAKPRKIGEAAKFDARGKIDPVDLSRFLRGELTAEQFAPGNERWAKVAAYLDKTFKPEQRKRMGKVMDAVVSGDAEMIDMLDGNERAIVQRLLDQSGFKPPKPPNAPPAAAGGDDPGGAKKRILSRIVPSDKNAKKLPSLNDIYTMTKDDLNPLRVLRNELTEGKDIPIEKDPYKLARLTRGSYGKAEQMLEHGTFAFKDLHDTGKSFKDVMEPVKKDLDGFRAYMAARRTIELAGRGIKTGIAVKDAAAVVREGAQKYAKPFAELVSFQRRVLDYLRDSGIVGPDAYAAMIEAHKDYVPFFRLMDDTSGNGKPTNSRSLRVKDPIKGMTGSERAIIDPIESIIKNTYLYVALAEKNRALTALDDLAASSPKGEQFMAKPKDKTPPVADAPLLDFLKENGIAADPNDFAVFKPEGMRPSKDTIAFYRNGKREVRQVDPQVAEAVNALDRESLGLVMRILAAPARLLRLGATQSPEFIVRNPIRDQFSAFILSENGYVPVYDMLKGLGSIFTHDAGYQNWLKSGGANSTLLSVDRKYIEREVMKLSNPTVLGRLGNVVRSPLDFLRMVSELMENATRVGEFKRATKKGKSPMEAGFGSREVTLDFARIGAQMRWVNALVAFFNASVEGTDREIRAFKKHPLASTLKAAAAITLPSVLLWFANHDDDRYKELPQWQKDLFWIILPSDKKAEPWRIPKPFALGMLFGSVPERVLSAYHDKHPNAFKHLGKSLSDALIPNYWPQFLVPLVEQFSNKSTFSERPIVPKYLENVEPQYQSTPFTSETAKLIGKAIAKMGGDKSSFASPQVIDNYIRSWTGGLGQHVVAIADKALKASGVVPSRVEPTKTWADIPVVKAFAVRHPSAGAQSIQDFYDTYDERKKAAGTVRHLTKIGEPDAAAAVREDRNLETAEKIHKALGQQMKVARDVWLNKTLNADEKRQLIDSTYMQAIEIAKRGNEIFRATEKSRKDLQTKTRQLETAQ